MARVARDLDARGGDRLGGQGAGLPGGGQGAGEGGGEFLLEHAVRVS